MSRRTIRLAVAGGAVAASVLVGGTAFAADSTYPQTGGSGGNTTTGGTGTSDTGTSGSGTSTTSTGGNVTSGGSGTSSTGSSGSSLPFTGFELATALTLGVGAIGAGGAVVVASRRKRDSSAVA